MSIIPPETPVGRPKPYQMLVEEMLKAVDSMINEVEEQARKSRFNDLNFLIPFTVFFGAPLEKRLETAKQVINFIKESGAPPEALGSTVKEMMEAIKPQTTLSSQIIRSVTEVSENFIECLMELAKGVQGLYRLPQLHAYTHRIHEVVVQLSELTSYSGRRRVVLASPSSVYSHLVEVKAVLNMIYPYTLGAT